MECGLYNVGYEFEILNFDTRGTSASVVGCGSRANITTEVVENKHCFYVFKYDPGKLLTFEGRSLTNLSD